MTCTQSFRTIKTELTLTSKSLNWKLLFTLENTRLLSCFSKYLEKNMTSSQNTLSKSCLSYMIETINLTSMLLIMVSRWVLEENLRKEVLCSMFSWIISATGSIMEALQKLGLGRRNLEIKIFRNKTTLFALNFCTTCLLRIMSIFLKIFLGLL